MLAVAFALDDVMVNIGNDETGIPWHAAHVSDYGAKTQFNRCDPLYIEGRHFKAPFSEMTIKGVSRFDLACLHNFETKAVCKA